MAIKEGQQYIKKAEAARVIGCARKTLYTWIDNGVFTVVYLDPEHKKIPRLLVDEVTAQAQKFKTSEVAV